ncbi:MULTISPECIES: ABC transporter ATP-binding protein [Psychrilyobacter]|uniref:ATP-binding cassette domain-containing protein n=1 Tax=Psychrilyobacter piezotolerans TaxID=2293438 RepID=A0ABX9KHF6_9FUSO|nr:MULTISPECIES: ABC transporter ATP-binding protein [Psychrilyobacter]MCS5420699.1 ABC transporter ATP-binding protein [Psychrilyobacter sp. S5]NDI78025.1 ABC transporter ATP-binding protein [Psychrilyobacter piezotolerans]RDE61964.1 ABC transporter ATP-binding protein [Psychrilyobacter sp. S5]REI41190.1 ATP-binding cassette domain-containing protein [Psychrilyobacter piezotolerans]
MEKLIELKDVKTSFFTHLGEVQAVRGVSYSLNKGEALGIVGESGSGKSITSMSVMGLLQYPGTVKSGEIVFKGEDLLKKNKKEMMSIRGNEIAMIFQDPMTSLNPVYTVGDQIMEAIRKHQNLSKAEALKKAIEMLELVGIPDPTKRINAYPHEFSGGMRQRVMIAIALSCEPDLLIADEPTTALDVTIQAQILDLMKELKDKLNTSIVLITHDLGVVADVCSRVLVMYGGLIMEEGKVEDIFYNPKHPYTVGLLKSIPKIEHKERLVPIDGTPPDLLHPPKGCPFAARCEHAMNICMEERPEFFNCGEGHKSMCWLLHPDSPKTELKGGVR